jgi:uncharacterized protein YhjY with autotransporter beta-barrel domain
MKTVFSLLRTFLIPLLSILFFLPGSSWAAAAKITCSDVSDPDSCSIDNISVGFARIISDVLEGVDNPADASDNCSQDSPNSYTCKLMAAGQTAPQTFRCTKDGPLSASCKLLDSRGIEQSAALFSLGCSVSAAPTNGGKQQGTCQLATDPEQIETLLARNMPTSTLNEISLGTNLLAGCALQAGVDSDDVLTPYQRDCNTLSRLVANQQYGEAAALIREVTPRNPDLATDTSRSTLATQVAAVGERLSRVRRGAGGGFDATSIRWFDGSQWLDAGLPAPVGGSAGGETVAFPDDRLGVFVNAAILRGEQEGDAAEGAAEQTGSTFTLGIDYRINDGLVAGVAYSLANTDAEFGGGNEMNTNGYSLLGYGTWYVDQWYVESTLAFGSQHNDQFRRLDCALTTCGTSFALDADAQYYGSQDSFTLAGGHEWSFGALSLTPNVQYAMTSIDTDGYTETTSDMTAPGAGFLLQLDDTERELTTLSAGINGQYAISTGFGVVIPQGSVEWRKELDDDVMIVNGQFVGDVASGDSFSLISRTIDTSYGVVGAGVSVQMTGGSSAFVDVKSIVGYEDLTQSTYTAGWRWSI